MEDRDDLSELLLNGLPEDERKHVINVIRQGDEDKLRRKRAEGAIPSQDADRDHDGYGDGLDDDAQDGEFADASE